MYGFFEKRNKTLWWAIITTVEFMLMMPFLGVIMAPLFYTPEYVASMVSILPFIVPVIIIECIAGAYLGYKIYKRTEKIAR